MTPEGLARVATPDVFGLYEVRVDPQTEVSLFNNLAGEFDEPVWYIDIHRALFSLNVSTLRELKNYEGEVPIAFACKVNMREQDLITKILLTPVEFITDLDPIIEDSDDLSV